MTWALAQEDEKKKEEGDAGAQDNKVPLLLGPATP